LRDRNVLRRWAAKFHFADELGNSLWIGAELDAVDCSEKGFSIEAGVEKLARI
jgi:hypothetical protein